MKAPEHIVITDPELALSIDPFPPDVPITGVGAFSGEWPNFGTMLEERTNLEAELLLRTKSWQHRLEPPLFIIRNFQSEEHGFVLIYGRLMTPEKLMSDEMRLGADINEARNTAYRIRNAARRGWLWGRFYSRITPKGEPGTIHRSQISEITNASIFATAQRHGWP